MDDCRTTFSLVLLNRKLCQHGYHYPLTNKPDELGQTLITCTFRENDQSFSYIGNCYEYRYNLIGLVSNRKLLEWF